MWIVDVLILAAGGVLGAASLIVSKKPNAQELIDKLTPYQGWIGVVLFLWGIWSTISAILNLGLLTKIPLVWIIWTVTAVTMLLLGFMLGYGLITQYALSKNEQAMQKGQQIRQKLAAFQGPIGLVAIGLAVFYLVLRIIY